MDGSSPSFLLVGGALDQTTHLEKEKPAAGRLDRIRERLITAYHWLNKRSGGWLETFTESGSRFTQMRGQQAAASLAYYALFSLFPLTLLLAWLLDLMFSGDLAYLRAIGFIRTVFPFSGDVVDSELRNVFTEQRSTLGVLGGIGLLWAASGFFTTLAININRAWPMVKLRNFVNSRLVAFAMVGAVILLMMVSILTTTLMSVIPSMLFFFGDSESISASPLWLLILRLVSAVFTFLTFLGMYRWIPNKVVRWKAVLIGALFSTIGWEAARSAFTLYLSSGFASFQFVYGSLSALIALMIWTYIGNLVALFGAYLVATLDLRLERERKARETPEVELPVKQSIKEAQGIETTVVDKHIRG